MNWSWYELATEFTGSQTFTLQYMRSHGKENPSPYEMVFFSNNKFL
jgi:hypothetical protein